MIIILFAMQIDKVVCKGCDKQIMPSRFINKDDQLQLTCTQCKDAKKEQDGQFVSVEHQEKVCITCSDDELEGNEPKMDYESSDQKISERASNRPHQLTLVKELKSEINLTKEIASSFEKCRSNCMTGLVFSTDERYNPQGYRGIFQCCRCDAWRDLSKGFYVCVSHSETFCPKCVTEKGAKERQAKEIRCSVQNCSQKLSWNNTVSRGETKEKMPYFICSSCKKKKNTRLGFYYCSNHSGSDRCENCFVAEGGVAYRGVSLPTCLKCPEELRFSVIDWLTKTGTISSFMCNSCAEEIPCKQGGYRCMNHNYGLCDSCYGERFNGPNSMSVFVPCCYCHQEHKLQMPSGPRQCIYCQTSWGQGELLFYGCQKGYEMCYHCYCFLRQLQAPLQPPTLLPFKPDCAKCCADLVQQESDQKMNCKSCSTVINPGSTFFTCNLSKPDNQFLANLHTVLCKKCFVDFEKVAKRTTHAEWQDIMCTVCEDKPIVYSKWPRYTQQGAQYTCNRCKKLIFQQTGGHFTCIIHDEDVCKKCYIELQFEEKDFKRKKEDPQYYLSGKTIELLKNAANKIETQVNCRECCRHNKLNKTPLFFSQDEKYLSYYTRKFKCAICFQQYFCDRGFFSCKFDHKQSGESDLCIDCFLLLQDVNFGNKIFTKCSCGRSLVNSLEDRYSIISDLDQNVKCFKCKRKLNQNKGFYRCYNQCYGLCSTCFNFAESKAKQREEIRGIVFDEHDLDTPKSFLIKSTQLNKEIKSKDVNQNKKFIHQVTVKHLKCGKALVFVENVKKITCKLCAKTDSEQGYFICNCQTNEFRICKSCFKKEKSAQHLFDEPKAVSLSQESMQPSAEVLVQDYIKKSSRHRMKYVKTSFVGYFQNPLAVYDNQEGECHSFFAIKKIESNPSLVFSELSKSSSEQGKTKVSSFITEFDFTNNPTMSSHKFARKRIKVLEMFKNCKSFDDFSDADRRKLLFKHLLSEMSKDQAEQLCIEIFQTFKNNLEMEANRNKDEKDDDRAFGKDLFRGIEEWLEQKQKPSVTSCYELIKYVDSDGDLKKANFIEIPDYTKYIKAMTGDCLFQVDDAQGNVEIVDFKDLKVTTSFKTDKDFKIKDAQLLFKKFLLGDVTFQNEDFFVIMELVEEEAPILLLKVKKEHARDNFFIVPNSTILSNNLRSSSEISSLKLEDLNLTFLYEQNLESSDGKSMTQIYSVGLKNVQAISLKFNKQTLTKSQSDEQSVLRLQNLHLLRQNEFNESMDSVSLVDKEISELLEPIHEQIKHEENHQKHSSIVFQNWKDFRLGKVLDERLSQMDFTRDGKNVILYTTSGLYHMDLTKFKANDSKSAELEWERYTDTTLQKEMYLFRDNFIFEISKLDQKIIARPFTKSEFKVSNDSNSAKTLPSLINRSFRLDDRYLIDIMRTKNEVRILGMDENHHGLRINTQKIGEDGRLDDEPQSIILESETIYSSFPIVASADSSTIRIQSFTQPSRVHELKIQQLNLGSFIQFLHFRSLEELCLVDKRTNFFSTVPFDQTWTRIAFLTSQKGLCKKKSKCTKGDISINLLEINPYSQKMLFRLHKSPYQACMEQGIRENLMIKAYSIKAISDRGTDIVLVCQYNNCIIFDCVTSIIQQPIKLPLSAEESKQGSIFQKLANPHAKKGSMVRVELLMDDQGSLFWVHRPDNKEEVVVFRHNPKLQMSHDDFISTAWQTDAVYVQFFLFSDGKFYFMDQTHIIKMLVWNEESKSLQAVRTLQYVNTKMNLIEKNNFDKFLISQKVLHNKDNMFYLMDIQSKPSETFKQAKVMRNSDEYRHGPWAIDGSSMMLQLTTNEMVLMPLGDQSNIDFLPISRTKNQIKQYSSYIDQHNQIITCFGGQVLFFSETGRFLSQVAFPSAFLPNADDFCLSDYKTIMVEKLNDNFSQHRFQLVMQDDKESDECKFHFKRVGEVSNEEMRVQFNPQLIQKYEKAIYDDFEQEIIAQEINRNLPVYWLSDNVISTFIWRIYPQKGILFQHNQSYPAEDSTLIAQACQIEDNQQGEKSSRPLLLDKTLLPTNKTYPHFHHKSILPQNSKANRKCDPILFNFELCIDFPRKTELFDESEIAALYSTEKEKIKRLTEKYESADREVLLHKFEQTTIKLVVNELYYVLRIFNSVVFIKKTDLVRKTLSSATLLSSEGGVPRSSSIRNNQSFIDKYLESPMKLINIALNPDSQYIDSIHKTGIDHLIQIVVFDFELDLFYIITHNLETNKQHSLYQGAFYKHKLPTNYLIKSFELDKKLDFNYVFDQGAIVNLATGIPIQFLDEKTQHSLIPYARFNNSEDFSKRLSYKKTFFLDTNHPGRQFSFISLSELIYWARFKVLKQKHEIYHANLQSIYPLLRAPTGVSVLRHNLSNPVFISKFCNAIQDSLERHKRDYFHKLINLSVLYNNPVVQPQNALALSINKNMMSQFSEMIELLTERTDIHITSFFQANLDKFIGCVLPGVNDFLNQSFVQTEQYDEPVFLETTEKEIIISSHTTFMDQTTLQKLIDKEKNKPGYWAKYLNLLGCRKREKVASEQADDKQKKQMKVRVLNFNWLSDLEPGKSGKYDDPNDTVIRNFIRILARTENDSVFATQHVRILVDYLWNQYFTVILYTLFLPYMFFFLSFHLLATWFNLKDIQSKGDVLNRFRACYVLVMIFGIYYVIQECREFAYKTDATFARRVLSYLNFWNLVDFLSIVLGFTYTGISIWIAEHGESKDPKTFMETQEFDFKNANLIGSVAILLFWTKMFYWMRLFKPFAAFIRMIMEMIQSSAVFFCMLFLLWLAFANAFVLVQKNRDATLDPSDSIFPEHLGVGLLDASIYVYLVGLGEFHYENFDLIDSRMNWFIFILSTYIIQLVFMNVLIALMTDAYVSIKQIQKQSVLKEQVSLIENYSFLISKETLFNSNKYLVHLKSEQLDANLPQMEKNFAKLRQALSYKTEVSEDRMLARISQNEERVRKENSRNMALIQTLLQQIANN